MNSYLQGTTYRYIIWGKPENRLYTIEEARWEDLAGRLEEEWVHQLTPSKVKKWLGYLPTTIGEPAVTLWMFFPTNVLDTVGLDTPPSPMALWLKTDQAFAPYDLARLRLLKPPG